jgi:hypothetical protein
VQIFHNTLQQNALPIRKANATKSSEETLEFHWISAERGH